MSSWDPKSRDSALHGSSQVPLGFSLAPDYSSASPQVCKEGTTDLPYSHR